MNAKKPSFHALLMLAFYFFSNAIYSQCSFSGLDPEYCINDAASTLTGTPGGGTFSGPGMTGNIFTPSDAGVGTHTVTYTIDADGDKYYIKSNTGDPWGNTSNNTCMDDAFGIGGWTLGAFETIDPAVVFTAATSFVFLDGSDFQAVELNTFLVANLATIETWVTDGGTLLINSAPNEGGSINFGFGGTTLNYPIFSGTVAAVDVTHPAFIGPLVPVSTAMTGPFYAHGTITGAGYTNVLVNGADVILAEKAWGLGTVAVGGMTTANFHTPAPDGTNFRSNYFTYLNSLAAVSDCIVTQDVVVHDLPTVTATATPDEICIGESITFSGGGADTYAWDGGITDGVAFTPAASGTFTYNVTGTNTTTTCTNDASVTVTVNDNPTVTATATPDEICLGESITFTGGGADTYAWDGGITDGVAFTPAATGTFTYNVTGTNSATTCENTAAVTVTVNDNPTVTATATPDEICLGESITFTGGGADTYAWDGGITDGVAFTPAASGTFTYNVTGTNSATTCENTAAVTITVNDNPTVTATATPDEICIGESITFTGGGADTYAWDGGITDGVAFTPAASGTFTYNVTGTNSATTCENTAAVTVTVNDNPTVTATATPDEICLGESITFTGGGADTYAWDGGITDGVAFTPAASGTFTYNVTGTNSATTCENTAAVTVTVNDNPTVTATATPDEICIGESITFTGGGADTYAWDGGITDGDPFTPAATGTFTYTVTGTNTATSCSNTATVTVDVFDSPAVTATATPDEICLGESITFTGGGADTYVWDGGITDGVAFTPAATGTFTYNVTGTLGASECENTASVTITVNDNPTVTATATPDEICLGESITFTGGGADTYAWDGGITDGVAFTPAASGTFTYNVTGTNSATTCENTAAVTVTVNDNPTVTATATPDEICLGESITFTGGGADTYAWDGGITDGVAFTPAASGTFTYNVTGTNTATTCENTAAVTVTVNDNPTVTATATPDEICLGESITFTGGGADTYAWDGGITDGVAFTPAASGTFTYNVVGTNTATTCENTASVTVTVNETPTVTATATPDEICLGESITFTGGGADTYAWDGGVTDGDPFTPAASGTFTYTVTGTNMATLCESTTSVDITVYETPTVTATATPDEICLGESITFTGGGADTYTWDGGVTDGVPFTPIAAGSFTFNVIGSLGLADCENTASVTITVNDNPTVTATATPDEICLGESITFTGGGADTYAWDGGITDGAPFTPAASGTFTYNVTGTTTATLCENTASVTVTVHDNPDVIATATTENLCLGESVTLNGVGADTYVWDGGVTNGVPFTPVATGTFTYTVTGTNDLTLCENVASIDITINEVPTVTATVDEAEICIGESVIFTGGGADTYMWDGGVIDGVSFTPMAPGTFTYTVIGENDVTGCSNTASVELEVTVCEEFEANFELPSSVCLGECIILNNTSIGTITDYSWNFGGAVEPNTSTAESPTICFETPGIYDIELTVTNIYGLTDTYTATIVVNLVPDLIAYMDTIVTVGQFAYLSAESSFEGTYSWSPDNDIDCPDCQYTTTLPDDSTRYTVTFTSDEGGCTNSAQVMVLVNYEGGVGVPTAFSPNGDGVNDVLFVRGYALESVYFAIYNRYGELVFETSDQDIGWDGTFKGRDENPGVFTWVLNFDTIHGEGGRRSGNTVLIR